MDWGLSKRNALVTGASGGLGYSVAKALAEEGCYRLDLWPQSVADRGRGPIARSVGPGLRL